MIKTNKYQTQLTDEFINSLKDEVRTDLLDIINNVEFVRRLISPDRKRACEIERDSHGKILVDLANPHIMENMDYFRQAAIHFQKHGCYTKLMPNPNPQSEYGQWLRREVLRCWDGMVRESDGEWITGDMYFYLNYFPIIQTKIRKGTKVGDRVIDFPEVWEGVYWRFHYMEQARYGGIYDDFAGAKHCCEIARRGASKSYSMGSVLTKLFILGESKISRSKVKGLVLAYQKEYLIKDGILNKFIDGITHCSKFTQFPSKKLKAAMSDMTWRAGFLDQDTGLEMGTLNEVIGIAVKDDPDKPRGKRNQKTIWEEFGTFAKFLDTWQTALPNVQEGDVAFGQNYAIGCVCDDTLVYRSDGHPIKIQDVNLGDKILGYNGYLASIEDVTYIQDESYKECVEIICENGVSVMCSTDHPMLCVKNKTRMHRSSGLHSKAIFNLASEISVGDNLLLLNKVDVFGTHHCSDAYLLGLLFGDGNYYASGSPTLSVSSNELYEWCDKNYDIGISKLRDTKDGVYAQIFIKNIKGILSEYGMLGQSFDGKKLPNNIFDWDKESICNFLGGYFEADGNVQLRGSNRSIKLTCKYKPVLDSIKLLLLKIGINSNILTEKKGGSTLNSYVNGKTYEMPAYDCHVLYITHATYVDTFKSNIKFISKHKQCRLDDFKINSVVRGIYNGNIDFELSENRKGLYFEGKSLSNLQAIRVKSVKNIGFRRVYNLTANTTHTYITNGLISANTGGSEGSDFSGALEIIQHPAGYNVYSVPNVYDKGASGNKRTIFFFPGYINSKGHYNSDGVSDVISALVSEIEFRVNLKYNSSDPLQVTRRKAETAFTLQDAIMKRDGSMYPSDKLNDVINEINLNPKYSDDFWIGGLKISKDGKVEYKPNSDLKYITEFPHKDNKMEGAACLFKLPIKDSSGNVPWGRYIAGSDVYDDDASETLSLMSCFIMDLWTDEIVFEYTGRPMFADDAYEIIRLALLMYNAEMNYENNKKGLFKYFSQHNALYLLSDTLEFLKDKEMVKGGQYGNKSKGTGNYGSVAPYARRCIRDYLLKSKKTNVIKEVNGEVVQEEVSVFNYQKIPSKALLQELAMWSADGNYDRHDAMAMLMLLREDKMRMYGVQSPSEAANNRDHNYLGNDDFFSKNYKSKKDR